MKRLELCRIVLLSIVAALVIARLLTESASNPPPSTPIAHPTGPKPDFDYRGGEWLEGFCAMVRIYEWQNNLEPPRDDPRVSHSYDLRMGYPDRTVSINCEHKTIDIDREGGN